MVASGNGTLFTMLWLPGAVLLPLLLSAGLHVWIEVPALRWGRGYARKVRNAAVLSLDALPQSPVAPTWAAKQAKATRNAG